MGVELLREAKSSICRATAYQPVLNVLAVYRREHCNENTCRNCVHLNHMHVAPSMQFMHACSVGNTGNILYVVRLVNGLKL